MSVGRQNTEVLLTAGRQKRTVPANEVVRRQSDADLTPTKAI